jgi:hypothetical protein
MVVPATLAPPERHPGQPEDQKDQGQYPEKMYGEPEPGKQQHQEEYEEYEHEGVIPRPG